MGQLQKLIIYLYLYLYISISLYLYISLFIFLLLFNLNTISLLTNIFFFKKMTFTNKTQALLLAVVAIYTTLVQQVDAHGYLHVPAARNTIQSNAGCPQCLSAGGPAQVFSSNKYRHGMCGNSYSDSVQNWNEPGQIQATYEEGQAIEVEMAITAHHVGYFDFQLCDKQDISEECFFKNRLMRVGCDDENDPNCYRVWKHLTEFETGLWIANSVSPKYDGPAIKGSTTGTVTYKARLQLPKGVKCTNCVLRWHYFTTNSCTSPSNARQNSEEFFNCADIRINGKRGTSTPNTALASQRQLDTLLNHKPKDLYKAGSMRDQNMYYLCPRENNGRAIGFKKHYNLPHSQSCFSKGVGASCRIDDEDVPNNNDNNNNNNNNNNNYNNNNSNNNNNNNNNNNYNNNNNNDNDIDCGRSCPKGCMWVVDGDSYCYDSWSYDICSIYMPKGSSPPSDSSYYKWCSGDGDNNNNNNNNSNNNNNNNYDNNNNNNNNNNNSACSADKRCSGCLWLLSNGNTHCYPNWNKAVCQVYSDVGYTWCGN